MSTSTRYCFTRDGRAKRFVDGTYQGSYVVVASVPDGVSRRVHMARRDDGAVAVVFIDRRQFGALSRCQRAARLRPDYVPHFLLAFPMRHPETPCATEDLS